MIPYVEVLAYNQGLYETALVEPSECWFELSYYDIGECEVYAPATSANLAALKKGVFLAIPHKYSALISSLHGGTANYKFLWFVTSVEYTFNADGARMISARGFEAKWLLKKRVIWSPQQLPDDLGSAVSLLVRWSMGQSANAARKISNFTVRTAALGITLPQTQAPRAELAEYVNMLLKSYGCGSVVTLCNNGMYYDYYKGADRSGAVVFSQSLDNLLSSTYVTDNGDKKNFVLAYATHTENNTTTESVVNYPTSNAPTGLDRDELVISSSTSTKYTDESGVEQETPFGGSMFQAWQTEEAKTELAKHIATVDFNGDIDVYHSQYTFGEDFFLGDLVGFRDEYFCISAAARVTKYTFKQDAGGYGELAEYGNE